MCGMYLYSYRVGHHGAHWFVVTVRVKPMFTESKVVCCCKCELTAGHVPPSGCTSAKGAAYATILFVREP